MREMIILQCIHLKPSLFSLRETGFVSIQVITEDRDNGGCPEMELVAVKPK